MTWSYSRISCFEKCPLQYEYRYRMKLKGGEPSPALARGTAIHTLAECYLDGTVDDLPVELEKVRDTMEKLRAAEAVPEEWWHFHPDWDIADTWSWFVIKSDAYHFPKGDVAEIVDFKTGKMYPDHRDQLHLYATGAFARFPKVDRVIAKAVYIDQGTVLDFEWERPDWQIMKNNWEARAKRVGLATEFRPNPNRFCPWCDYNAANGGPCTHGEQ